ncbi:MAG: hypothetical protein ABI999_06770, partial [Acidobacteriota bacterium]
MNRGNIWIHIGIAIVLVTMAAIVGQIDRWREGLRVAPVSSPIVGNAPVGTVDVKTPKRLVPEVLVKFRTGVTLADIKRIAGLNHDQVNDEIESVKGLTVIDDLDNADATTVAAQYAKMKDVVDYAEVNGQVGLDDPASSDSVHDLIDQKYLKSDSDFELPSDPQFEQQWAHHNTGVDGGKSGADIHSLEAWKVTTGS